VIARIRLIACQPPLQEQDVYDVSRYFHLSSFDSTRDFFHAEIILLNLYLLGVTMMIHLPGWGVGGILSLKISFPNNVPLVGLLFSFSLSIVLSSDKFQIL